MSLPQLEGPFPVHKTMPDTQELFHVFTWKMRKLRRESREGLVEEMQRFSKPIPQCGNHTENRDGKCGLETEQSEGP